MIHVEHLTKEYRRVIRREGFLGSLRTLFSAQYETIPAVNDISFDIAEGELVGYIGPNGAGKSTSIKMLCGILVPTSGEIKVNGLIPHKDRMINARQIGAVFGQKTQLWWDVPVIESLRLFRDIYKVSEAQFQRNLKLFNELLDLHEFQNTPVRQLSLGQRLRADMAAALLHSPRLLFLDEPMIGVDVVAKERLRTFIKEINRDQKVTILLTTHDMTDIEKVCSRIMIIDHGRIVYDGSLEQIRAEYGKQRTLVVDFEEQVQDFAAPHAVITKSEGRKKWFAFNRFETSPSTLIADISSRYPILDLAVEEPEIEEIVRTIYRGKSASPATQSK
ncbi:MAG TPA: ATP-binding cassette domain-containing protein [Anaerolineales bacterium]|nr:ATP-binding cassette domain-containing protein [Anaerolineales bacterium]